MMRLGLFVIALGLGLGMLSGCASSDSGGWTKPGMTQEQMLRDTADCLNDSTRMEMRADGPRREVDQVRYRQCMANRGYTAGPAK